MSKLTPKEAATQIAKVLREHRFQSLFAGGCVRDMLLGLKPKDFDVATDARPEQVSEIFPRSQLVGAAFGVVIVRLGKVQVEVATFREDGRYLDGRHPESVIFGSAQSDARRRDFTINGMFIDPFDGTIHDWVGGQNDLASRLIRAIGEPAKRFAEDRLRILRAARFAARLDFQIEEQTLAAIHRFSLELPMISTERIRMELEAVLDHPSRSRGWDWLRNCRLLRVLVPQHSWSESAAEQVQARLSHLPVNCPWPVPLAVIFHDVKPKSAEELCRRLTCSNDVANTVGWLWTTVRRLLDPQPLELADYRFLRADPRTDGAAMLLAAELQADAKSLAIYEDFIHKLDSIDPVHALPTPFINGADLLAMSIPQGPVYSRILEAVYRDQLNERVCNRAEAQARVNELL